MPTVGCVKRLRADTPAVRPPIPSPMDKQMEAERRKHCHGENYGDGNYSSRVMPACANPVVIPIGDLDSPKYANRGDRSSQCKGQSRHSPLAFQSRPPTFQRGDTGICDACITEVKHFQWQ